MSRGFLAALSLIALCWAHTAAAQAPEPERTYEFLRRQGKLLYEYGKFGEATEALKDACADPQGQNDPSCHADLAVTAEKAGQIGVAIAAWEAASALGGVRAEQAATELGRLRGAYGVARVTFPAGRTLPTLPLAIAHTGMLIDPALKAYLSQVASRLADVGLAQTELWLPAGPYTLGAVTFEVPAGSEVSVALGPDVVPWRPRTFGMGDGPAMALGGPTELGVAFVLGISGIPGGGLGVVPVRPGFGLRLARHIGPLRLEVRGRIGGTPTRSLADDPDGERRATALEVLGALDLGVDLRLARNAFLTPHIGIEAGTLGSLLVACVAEDVQTLTVSVGECRLPVAALGGIAGLDLLLVPGTEPGRVGIRIGLAAEFLGAGLMAAPGDLLKDEAHSLVRSQTWRFARLGGLVDVGLALRF